MKALRGLLGATALLLLALVGGSTLPVSLRPPSVRVEHYSHGRFDAVTVYVPSVTPGRFVLFLSGSAGWHGAVTDMAQHLARQGVMVAGLDLPKLLANLEADQASCVFPDGDLENLSHFVQAYYHLPTYLDPILMGYSDGGTLAYAVLAQAPHDTFAGAVSVGFCPELALRKPLCKSAGLDFTPRADHSGVDLLPSAQLGNPWIVVPRPGPAEARTAQTGAADAAQACVVATTQAFVAKVPHAQDTDTDYATALARFTAQNGAAVLALPPAALKDLPIVAVPARPGAKPSDALAILLSGDGGWAGLDQNVAAALTGSGIPVVGLDSLRYFWSPRTPEGLARDLDRLIAYYLPQLGKKRVLLIGYSQGADVLPFAVNRLSPEARAHVALAAVMGLSEHALFEFHMTSWIADDDSGPPTLPEVERIQGVPVLCIYGEEETDSLCPMLDARHATLVKLKGGHHFDGDYSALAGAILQAAFAATVLSGS